MSKYKHLDKYLVKKGKSLSEISDKKVERELKIEDFKKRDKTEISKEELYDMILVLIGE